MKKRFLEKFTLGIWLVLLSIFAPLININNNEISFYQISNYLGFDRVFIAFLIIFIVNIILFVILFLSPILGNKKYYLTIIFLFTSIFYFTTPLIFKDGFTSVKVTNGAIILGITLILLFLYGLSFIFENINFSTQDLVEIALYLALAIILDLPFLKFKIVPSGGSISFAMFPLVLLALRKDFIKSFISIGIIYSLLNCLFDGYGFLTFPFDYLLGFGSLSLISLFRPLLNFDVGKKRTIKNLIIISFAIILACISRTIFSTISGILIYGLKVVPSLIYQLTYIGPSCALIITLTILLYRPFVYINRKLEK